MVMTDLMMILMKSTALIGLKLMMIYTWDYFYFEQVQRPPYTFDGLTVI